MKIIKELKQDPKLDQALNVEFYTHIRSKSFMVAFIVLMTAQALLYLVNMRFPLSAESVININIFLGVISPIISFIRLDQGNDMKEIKLKNTIKIQRAINDLTQEQLADLVCLTRKTINTVENNQFVPSTVLALKLARVLGVSVEELFMLEEY